MPRTLQSLTMPTQVYETQANPCQRRTVDLTNRGRYVELRGTRFPRCQYAEPNANGRTATGVFFPESTAYCMSRAREYNHAKRPLLQHQSTDWQAFLTVRC